MVNGVLVNWGVVDRSSQRGNDRRTPCFGRVGPAQRRPTGHSHESLRPDDDGRGRVDLRCAGATLRPGALSTLKLWVQRASGKGVRHQKCEAPAGPFRLLVSDTFSRSTRRFSGDRALVSCLGGKMGWPAGLSSRATRALARTWTAKKLPVMVSLGSGG